MLSPVSLTPAINCVDDRGLLLLQNYLRLPKSAPAAEVGHGRRYCHWTQPWKRAKAPSHTLIRGPGGHQNFFKPKRHYLVLAASGAYDQDVWDVYGCNFSWRFQWHHRRPWPTLAAGDIADLYPSTFSYLWQLPTSMASLFLSPAIYRRCRCSPVSTTPAITENLWQRLINFSPVSLTPLNSFSPVSMTPVWNTWRPGGHWFMKKTWSRKSRVRLPLKYHL